MLCAGGIAAKGVSSDAGPPPLATSAFRCGCCQQVRPNPAGETESSIRTSALRRGCCVGRAAILYEQSFNSKTISQGDFGHFRENNQIVLSKVAKIALKIVLKLKRFSQKITLCQTMKMHHFGSECLRPAVYSSLIGFTSSIVKSLRSRGSFIPSPLWTP